jgi:Xaa-Pro aminopeptidase
LAAQESGTLLPEASAPESLVRYDPDHLSAAFHRQRRQAITDVLPSDAVAIVFSSPQRNRSNDVDFPYRQSSDLYYLTGAFEPGTVLILAPGGIRVDGVTVTELLLVPSRDPHRETWTGRLLGPPRAESELGIEKAVEVTRFEEIVGPLLETRSLYHLPMPSGLVEGSALSRQIEFLRGKARIMDTAGGMEQRLVDFLLSVESEEDLANAQGRMQGSLGAGWIRGATSREILAAFLAASSLEEWSAWRDENVVGAFADGRTLSARLAGLRGVKTEEELVFLRRAIEITAAAHREALRSIEPGMHEYEVEAVIEYVFRRSGAEDPGFPSIVGSGENSIILHYEANRRRMEDGDLVVMDIGAEYRGYSADVTRTAPVSGLFSPEQRAIYELVLHAQEAGIAATRAGSSFGEPGRAASAVLAEGLMGLGLLDSPRGLSRFMMHGVSHYLGLDVHDVGDYQTLQLGNVITVEPGIYIPPAEDLDPKWWNIGVRIEDDVLVTDGDPVVLSAAAPKTVEEIEALMKETGIGNTPAGL